MANDEGKLKDAQEGYKKRKEEEDRREKSKEEETRRMCKAEGVAKKEVNALIEKQNEKSLKDLQITKVIPDSLKWEDEISDADKAKLQSPGAIRFFFLENGVITNTPGCFNAVVKKDSRTKKETTSYKVVQPEVMSARWCVIEIPSLQKVYWQWRKPEPEKMQLFAASDTVDLVQILFGGTNEAFEVYQKKVVDIVYVVSWGKRNEVWRHFESSPQLSIECFKPSQEKLNKEIKDLEKKINNLRNQEIPSKTNAIAQVQQNQGNLDDWCKKMKEYLTNYAKLKGEKDAGKDKKKKQELKDAMAKLENEAVAVFRKFGTFKDKIKRRNEVNDYVELGNITLDNCKEAERKYKGSVLEMISTLEKDRDALQTDLETAQKQKTEKEGLRDDWKGKYKGQAYKVTVVIGKMPEDVRNDLSEDERNAFRHGGKICHTMKPPCGVGSTDKE